MHYNLDTSIEFQDVYRERTIEFMKIVLTQEKDQKILDIGCGTGWLLRQIVKSREHITAIGIDISSNMIAAAKRAAAQENITNLEFIQGNWEDIDLSILSGKNISMVFCTSVFHYFIDPGIATKRMYESLSNGGHFFLLERDKADSHLTFRMFKTTAIKTASIVPANTDWTSVRHKKPNAGRRPTLMPTVCRLTKTQMHPHVAPRSRLSPARNWFL